MPPALTETETETTEEAAAAGAGAGGGVAAPSETAAPPPGFDLEVAEVETSGSCPACDGLSEPRCLALLKVCDIA